MKLSRTLGKLLEGGADEPFDTASWQRYTARRAVCFALGRTFELSDALVSLGHPATLTDQERGEPEVESMLAFHTSKACCAMRASIGYRCVEKTSSTDGAPT